MVYFNDDDAKPHSASTSSWSTPRRSRTPVSEDAWIEAPETPINRRSPYVQPGCASGSRTTPRHEESTRKCNRSPLKRRLLTYISSGFTSPGTPNPNDARTQSDGCIMPSKRFWSVIGPYRKPQNSSSIPRQTNPDSTAALEDSAVTPARGDDGYRPSKLTLIWVGVQTQ